MGATYLDRLINNIIETRFENFDQSTVNHAKNRIIDTIGCLIGGSKDSGNPQLHRLIMTWGGAPEASVLVYGDKVPVQHAAMLNSIMSRSFDFEPVSPYVDGMIVPGHISGTTIPTVLAIGEMYGISGKELITSLLVGDDMSTRVCILGGGESTFSWRDRVGPINLFGVTAIASRLMGLDNIQMRNAFGLLFTYMGGSHQTLLDATTAFKLSQGTSARDGIISVQLAKEGWTGAKDVLLSEFGYYHTFGTGVRDPEILIKNLGKEYYSDSTFKPYPCCRLNHSAIDSALAIVRNHEINIDAVEKVIIQVAPPVLKDILAKPFEIGDFPHANAIFSLQYTVATALLKKAVRPEYFTEEAFRDKQLHDFLQKFSFAELHEGNGESARIKLLFQDGKEISEYTEIASGDPQNPLSKNQLLDKFWNNIEFSGTISKENARKVLDMIENLEELPNVRELVKLLVA